MVSPALVNSRAVAQRAHQPLRLNVHSIVLTFSALTAAGCAYFSLTHQLPAACPPASVRVAGGEMGVVVGKRSREKEEFSVIRKPNGNYDWPGVPTQELGKALVKIGSNFVERSRELVLRDLDEFLRVYAGRPDKVNLCGIRINHALALFVTVRYLKPLAVVESGVNAGQSTYFIRHAAPDALIIAIDPLDKPICHQQERWVDGKNSIYYTGDKFKDIQEVDWATMINNKEIDPSRTLVFLDDHQNVFDRFLTFMKFGFRHVVLEDNYKTNKGSTRADKAGFTPKQMLSRQKDEDSEFLFHQLISYSEFPPLVPPIMARESTAERKKAGGFLHASDANTDIMAPILRPDIDKEDKVLYEKITSYLGIDPRLRDSNSYMQVMNYNSICYFELRPMAPRLAKIWRDDDMNK